MIQIVPEAQWRGTCETALDFAQKQVKALVERDPGFYPMYSEGGKWRHNKEAWTRWCDGFLPGMMWIFAKRTGSPEWFELAKKYSTPLEERKMDRDVHDLGFIFFSTYHRWHALTGEQELDDVVIQAGQTLALRFKEKGEYLSSFMGPESLFIDIMANVAIIVYAAQKTGDKALLDVAMKHCLTTRKRLIRGDGSSSHEGIFDLETGEFLRQSTQQGYRSDSCWSRGLAWAIYGFTSVYQATHDPRFLETAEQCADYYILNTPASGVPLMDYDFPPEVEQRPESSAAAIVAAGLLRLRDASTDLAKRALYDNVAKRMLVTLATPPYLASETPGWEGILKEGIYHLDKGLGVGESVMWGEYFFCEALDRALG
ncbi:MAG: glycoside hydrolase family 88 protein [Bryobacterales bacterium]|nr:glycoside hydrolase family 88 protein [Acidobacteriota bacterium]MCB9384108.1 glycoside hydrolase family 88 protein [Bryobacterales bacterium]